MRDQEGFEKGFGMLLRTAYKPVEPNEDFRSALLSKLKEKQAKKNASRSRRNVLYLSSMLAAAAAVMFAFAPALLVAPQGNASSSLQADTTASGDTAPMALQIGTDDPAPAVAQTVALPPLKNGSIYTLYPLEVRNQDDDTWQHHPANQTLTLAEGARIRAARSNQPQSGIRIADHGFLVLDEDAVIARQDGSFVLEQGCALVSSQDDKIDMRLAGKGVCIPAGGKVFMQVADQDRYAPGGAPAPVVVVMKGDPVITEPALANSAAPRQCALLPDSVYRLYDTPTGSYPRRALSEIERKNFSQMGDVILASYETE